MEDKDKEKQKNDTDDRIHVTKSVFQNAKEMQQHELEQQQKRQEELEKKRIQRERARQEARDKRLAEEKRELLKLKQGIIEESEIIHEEQEEEIQLTFWQKIGNFFYHNKWWLGMAAAIVFIFAYMLIGWINKPRPDMIVLFIGENQTVGEESELAGYISQFAEDFNGNGETLVSVYYIPYSENAQLNYANGVDTKLTAELQTADAVIVFANDKIDDIVTPENVFVNLSEIYPDNPNVQDYRFMLENTEFYKRIGVSKEYIKDGLFMTVRIPQRLMYSGLSEMQKTYDRDFPVFEKIIDDLTG